MSPDSRKPWHLLGFVAASMLAVGCATSAPPPEERAPEDPWEPLNRSIHRFNTGFDKVTTKPIAKVYEKVVPSTVRLGVTNFSRNLRGPLHIINHLLQGKPRDSLTETGRLLANSTFGLLGLIDVATDMGLERKPEDFGQTLARWGVPDGPFVVVPFLGADTLRDALTIPLNLLADPLLYYDVSSVRDRLYFLRLIDVRQRLFTFEALIEDSPDLYLTIRESHLQRRRFLIYDGNPPVDEDFYDDFYDEEFDERE